MWKDLSIYINSTCKINNGNNNQNKCNDDNNIPCKVVEIAIGKFFEVSDNLSSFDNINFVSTDIDPGRKDVVFDDITNPNMDIYKNTKIIYSIRPPQELQSYIEEIVNKIGAILIIKPFFNEDLAIELDMDLINYKKAVFYQSMNTKNLYL